MTALDDFIGELRLERLRRRIQQGDLAAQLGIAQSRLSAFEASRKRPGDVNLRRWAEALGVAIPDGVEGWVQNPAQCGTDSGYTRHNRNHESTCEPCRVAHREAHTAWRDRTGR